MKAAKIITFIAFISNSYLSFYSWQSALVVRPIFNALQAPTPFPWPLLFTLIFLIGSIIFWFYLRNKYKKGENVKFALWVSIALLLIPILLIILILAFTYTQPIYDQMRAI